MREYEAICIFNPKTEEVKIDTLLDKFQKRIKSSGGEVEKISKWGKKDLPYTFNKFKTEDKGFYVYINFKGESTTPRELENQLKNSEEIMRFMVVKVERPSSLEIPGAPVEEKVEINPEMLKEEEPSGQS